MTWYEKIIAAHTDVTDQVSHGGRLKSDRYFVWQEEGSNDFLADGKHGEKAMTGTTDLFTKAEFDSWKELFETSLDSVTGIAWRLNSVQYEVDTRFWHYEWTWTVVADGVLENAGDNDG